ncbi:bifunctional DNA primase/polymerase [Spongiactinospora sp. TRM90649]|uniref:bifunctional DNA primase/polymerase n=1 Tax=Spongiactinospora sp. TRM90649 TaxID=3031114 RepID=UPI0023F97D1C|nr:bifunctional DNA primase/polymerase [Spongiactinospora sp. TRM90649]MDF5755433.1 bifunctional DNA primase/polymerase [Spongiactinospora sp. TRM90649]
MNPGPMLRYALAAAARGWHVFPLTPGGKMPPRGFTRWQERATTDPGTIRAWWTRGPFNVGIATGPSRLVVIDLDKPKDGLRPPSPWDLPGIHDGADVLALLCERAGQPLPFETFTVRTRRGGTHLYYTAPSDGPPLGNTQGSNGGLGWLIDTRANGGIIVGPGSRVDLPDGTGSYDVIHAVPAAPLPGWLAEQLRPAPRPPQRPVVVELPADRRGAYLRTAVASELERVTGSPPDGHNTALYRASVALGQLVAGGELAQADVTAWLTDAARQVGQPYGEATRTIASGLRAGARRPRTVAA